jgi:methylglyoxal synthase
MAGDQGGAEQIVARVACNEIDLVLFFRDPISNPKHNQIEANLLQFCDSQNIPIATNIATAEVLIHGLERGDLEWRNIVNPNNSEDYI